MEHSALEENLKDPSVAPAPDGFCRPLDSSAGPPGASSDNPHDEVNPLDTPLDPFEDTLETQGPNVKALRRRLQLDLAFFRGRNPADKAAATESTLGDAEAPDDDEEPPSDRLWDLFLTTVMHVPPLEDVLNSESAAQPHGQPPSSSQRKALLLQHTDHLLCVLRRWSQDNFPAGLSLQDFAERTERCSASNAFHDYRMELIHRYKTTDWKKEVAEMRSKQAHNQKLFGSGGVSPGPDEGGGTRNHTENECVVGTSQSTNVQSRTPTLSVAEREQIRKKRESLLALQKRSQAHAAPPQSPQANRAHASAPPLSRQPPRSDVLTTSQAESLRAKRRMLLQRQKRQAPPAAPVDRGA